MVSTYTQVDTKEANIASDEESQDVHKDAVAETFEVILASSSPRRTELLSQAGILHTVRVCPVDESLDDEQAIDPCEAAKKLAERKARAVVETMLNEGFEGQAFVIGADTMVVAGPEILGKPHDKDDARRMLSLLSGKKHQVVTGVSCWFVLAGEDDEVSVGMRSFSECAFVTFRELEKAEIEDYLESPEPYDKAGAYAFQGEAHVFVERLEGEKDCVIGLPVQALLRRFPELIQG